MELNRDQIRQWVASLLDGDETLSSLARKAGLATTTLTRFMHDDQASMLTLRSLAKIAHVKGVPPWLPATKGMKPTVSRPLNLLSPFSEEAEPYTPNLPGGQRVDDAINALIAGENGFTTWRLKTRALELVGYLPDDIVIVDLTARPVAGDVVCAQNYDWKKGEAATIWRIYEMPYLIAATYDPSIRARLQRPLLVDNEHVIIQGVIVWSLRDPAHPNAR